MSEGELDATRLAGAAELLTRYPFILWSYGESIGLEGLLAASEQLDEPRYAGICHGLLKGWAARADLSCRSASTAAAPAPRMPTAPCSRASAPSNNCAPP